MSGISSQSQEAIAAIDAELESIIHKKRKTEKKEVEHSDTESIGDTESEIEDEDNEIEKKEKKESVVVETISISPSKKRSRGDQEAERLGSKYVAKISKLAQESTQNDEEVMIK